MIKRFLLVFFFLFFSVIPVAGAQDDGLESYSFEEAQKVLKKQDVSISFETIVKELMQGNLTKCFQMIADGIKESLFAVLTKNNQYMKQLIFIALVAAIFHNFSDAFTGNGSSEAGFYVAYIFLIGLMSNSFYFMSEITKEAVECFIDFMKGLMTAYSLAVVTTTGVTTSIAIYQLYLMMLYGISFCMKVILLPGVKILFVLNILNHLSKEEKIRKLTETLEWGISTLLKWGMGCVLGVQLIQSMLLPAVDSVKKGIFQKGISMIPGIGEGVSTVTTTLLGSAIVIKNSIGVGGILILILLASIPIFQIAVILFSYMGIHILLQPISDKRIGGALESIVISGKLLIRILLTISILFLLFLAIIAFSTNVNYYAG